MSLPDLIAALEAAGEGSPELDARIAVEIFETKYSAEDLVYAREIRKDDDCARGTYWVKSRSGASLRTAPAYTTSIDAAMTLVPAGPHVCWSIAKPTTLIPWGRVWLRETGDTLGESFASTYSLALCIAALKARAA